MKLIENLTFIVKSITTEDDANSVPDIVRILWIVGVVYFFVLAGWSCYKTGNFAAADFGAGFGAIMALGGAALWAKKKADA